ncbi:hypothetical protein PROFUN_05022 [Planoprotostelium fungivorum]|uniref:Translation initiation factor eIF2B subunit gamma n=1 Tax=Planoprotostelium fungivorum TaxID=1890364 RepID=A0A2P6NS66_9EUKA|nr:hypothetical protein PROFUN_05022 [Planoprotostelium fungivorum]
MAKPEFQVVILAGGTGSRLTPLSEGLTKPMLPVANRPLISYQLELLERVGFTEAIILTNMETMKALDKYVGEIYKGELKLIFENTKGSVGTVDALLRIKDKIKRNFIVISGDVIVSESFLHHMADIHRTRNAAVTMLLKKNAPLTEEEKKAKQKSQTLMNDFIGLDAEGKVMFLTAAADLEEHVAIRKDILKQSQHVTLYTNLLDAHFFIFADWVLELISQMKEEGYNLSSIKQELVPFLILLQRTKKIPTKNGGLKEFIKKKNESMADILSSKRTSREDGMGCFGYIMSEDQYCIRVNTLDTYRSANFSMAKGTTGYLPEEEPGKNNFISSSALVDVATQVGPESVVGSSTSMGPKGSVKKSIIGRHVKIGKGVKIINSIIMDYVTIGDDCVVQNSIICNEVQIGDGCSLNNCSVGKSYSMEPKTKATNETLQSDSIMMVR